MRIKEYTFVSALLTLTMSLPLPEVPRPEDRTPYKSEELSVDSGRNNTDRRLSRTQIAEAIHKPSTKNHEFRPKAAIKLTSRNKKPMENVKEPMLLSPNGDRVQFQIHGHEGPRSYIFGFDTGRGKGRQFRLEEMLPDGTVKGQYGYYDATGKLRTVKYVSRPFGGFETSRVSNARRPEVYVQ